MDEHRIRLRGPWEMIPESGPGAGTPTRVTLPSEWPAGGASRFRLRRRFGRPPLDPSRDALRLEMDRVPGLVSARVNDHELAPPPAPAVTWSAPLNRPLLARNELVLVVDLGSVAPADLPGDWGRIELAIGPVDP